MNIVKSFGQNRKESGDSESEQMEEYEGLLNAEKIQTGMM